MKNYLYILCVCLYPMLALAQNDDPEELPEIFIDKMSRAKIEQMITKVRNQTYHNYVPQSEIYNVKHLAVLNDTLQIINTNEDYNVGILFQSKKINKSIHPNSKNEYKINEPFFSRYSFNDSPIYWLTEFVIRKYVNIPDLDFLNNFSEYEFIRSVDNKITKIDFYSDDMYEGYFTFDQNYNLMDLSFSLVKPYPIDHSQTRNGKRMFVKNWLYTTENVQIRLTTDENKKLVIKSMQAAETIEKYNFQRYNSKSELLMEDKNLSFKSKLSFELK